MRVWREWHEARRELGWPSQSCEVRCLQAAQVGAVGGSQPAGSRPLPIDRARLGPQVHRALLDIGAGGPYGERCAYVLVTSALQPRVPAQVLAAEVGLSRSSWVRARSSGLLMLGAMV